MEITLVSPSTNSGVQTQAWFYSVSHVLHVMWKQKKIFFFMHKM